MSAASQNLFDRQQQNNTIKNQAHGHVTSGRLPETKEIFKQYNINTYEELSQKGYDWNCLHYAVHFDQPKVLEWLILHTYHQHPTRYLEILNLVNNDKRTPAMMCLQLGKKECFKLFLKYGGVDGNIYNYQNQSILDYSCDQNYLPDGISELKQLMDDNKQIIPNWQALESADYSF